MASGVIIIDKPAGWTSHDVVGKLRGLLRERRIGHGGTLDPMATGVLPVFVGRATRAVEFCENAEKEYIAGMRFGIVTDTQDTTGTVIETRKADVSDTQLQAVIGGFIGTQLQVPPMYSAVKVGGKKLYELARKGVEIERKPREITVKELEHIRNDGGDPLLRIVCSKGTYVRVLCHDIGAKLGCGAAMSSLRRTRAGAFTLSDALTLEEVIAAANEGKAESLLRAVDGLFSDLPEVRINELQEKKCRCGTDFNVSEKLCGRYRVYSETGEFLMLGEAMDGRMVTVKSFFEV